MPNVFRSSGPIGSPAARRRKLAGALPWPMCGERCLRDSSVRRRSLLRPRRPRRDDRARAAARGAAAAAARRRAPASFRCRCRSRPHASAAAASAGELARIARSAPPAHCSWASATTATWRGGAPRSAPLGARPSAHLTGVIAATVPSGAAAVAALRGDPRVAYVEPDPTVAVGGRRVRPARPRHRHQVHLGLRRPSAPGEAIAAVGGGSQPPRRGRRHRPRREPSRARRPDQAHGRHRVRRARRDRLRGPRDLRDRPDRRAERQRPRRPGRGRRHEDPRRAAACARHRGALLLSRHAARHRHRDPGQGAHREHEPRRHELHRSRRRAPSRRPSSTTSCPWRPRATTATAEPARVPRGAGRRAAGRRGIGLSVGATMPNGQAAAFSTHNIFVSLAAPGRERRRLPLRRVLDAARDDHRLPGRPRTAATRRRRHRRRALRLRRGHELRRPDRVGARRARVAGGAAARLGAGRRGAHGAAAGRGWNQFTGAGVADGMRAVEIARIYDVAPAARAGARAPARKPSARPGQALARPHGARRRARRPRAVTGCSSHATAATASTCCASRRRRPFTKNVRIRGEAGPTCS